MRPAPQRFHISDSIVHDTDDAVGDEARKKQLLVTIDTDSRQTVVSVALDEKADKTVDVLAKTWSRLQHVYGRFGGKHVSLMLLLLLYSLLAACLLWLAEKDEHGRVQQEAGERLTRLKANFTDRLVRSVWSNTGRRYDAAQRGELESILELFGRQLGGNGGVQLHWDFWGALFFVGTIYTTIGYGNISPRTRPGQVLTIACAVFGIPLVFAIMADLGKSLCVNISCAWHAVEKACRRRKNNTERGPQLVKVAGESATLPVSAALAVCLLYLLACAGLFCIWERDWNYFTSVYFIFISLSTIGLGDVVPSKPRMLLLCFWLVIIGLALVAMVVNVIQIKIEEWLSRVALSIQAEYERAMEMGDCPEKQAILERTMKKQPWLVRNLAPAIMSERQVNKLEHINRQFVATDNKAVQTTAVQVQMFCCQTEAAEPSAEKSCRPDNRPRDAEFGQQYRVPVRDAVQQTEDHVPPIQWDEAALSPVAEVEQDNLQTQLELVGGATDEGPQTSRPPAQLNISTQTSALERPVANVARAVERRSQTGQVERDEDLMGIVRHFTAERKQAKCSNVLMWQELLEWNGFE